MADKLMYIPNDDTQNLMDIQLNESTYQNLFNLLRKRIRDDIKLWGLV